MVFIFSELKGPHLILKHVTHVAHVVVGGPDLLAEPGERELACLALDPEPKRGIPASPSAPQKERVLESELQTRASAAPVRDIRGVRDIAILKNDVHIAA